MSLPVPPRHGPNLFQRHPGQIQTILRHGTRTEVKGVR